MSLTQQLTEKKEQTIAKVPSELLDVMFKATQDLIDNKLASKAPQKGDKLADFDLPNVHQKNISLSNILKEGRTIVSFYRGGWCPYCNLELKALNNILPQLKNLNTSLVAITPETPDNSLTTSEKNELEFEVLSDIDNKYAKELNLVFQLPEHLQKIYTDFKLDISKHNGNNDFELPMPATFVVDKDGNILYSFVSEDYTTRLDPEVILEVLKN